MLCVCVRVRACVYVCVTEDPTGVGTRSSLNREVQFNPFSYIYLICCAVLSAAVYLQPNVDFDLVATMHNATVAVPQGLVL